MAPDRYTELPDACGLISSPVALQVVGKAEGESSLKTKNSEVCRWDGREQARPDGSAEDADAYRRALTVSIYLHRSPGEGTVSGEKVAATAFSARKENDDKDTDFVDGVGDEAYSKIGDGTGLLLMRRANVTVELRYEGHELLGNGAKDQDGEDVTSALVNSAKSVDSRLQR